MGNKSKPVTAVAPKVRPAGFTDGAWAFPERLAQLAKRKGWFVSDLVKASGVSQSTIWKWLHYESEKPSRKAVREIELKAGIPVGSLLQEPDDGIITHQDVVLAQLEELADRLGIDDSVVGILTNDQLGAAMKQFSPQVRGAILGLLAGIRNRGYSVKFTGEKRGSCTRQWPWRASADAHVVNERL